MYLPVCSPAVLSATDSTNRSKRHMEEEFDISYV